MKALSKYWTLLVTLLLLSSASAVADNTWQREMDFPRINSLPFIFEDEEEILSPEEVLNQLFNLVGQQYQLLLLDLEQLETDEERGGIYNDYLDELEELLELLPQDENPSNININTPADNSATLLGLAAQLTDTNVINALLNNGANPHLMETVTIEGRNVNLTPLGIARESRNVNTFTAILLRLHPESIIEGLTPLQHAVRSGLTNVTAELLDRNPELINATPEARRIPLLHIAIGQNDEAMLSLLLENERGADINLQDGEDGRTPLQTAITEGNIYAFNTLLEHGTDTNLRDFNQNTALHFAVEQENPEFLIRLLAIEEIELNPLNDEGHTPLHTAVETGNANAVRILLTQEGLDINAAAEHQAEREILGGTTPLHTAAADGNKEIAIQLLVAGANPRARDYYDDTPAMTARAGDFERLANEIERYALLDFKGSYIVTDNQNQVLADFRPIGERFVDALTQATMAGLITLIMADIQSTQAQPGLQN